MAKNFVSAIATGFLLLLFSFSPAAKAVEVTVDDGSKSFRSVADHNPFVPWDSLEQSITATDAHITFGFRLRDLDDSLPSAGQVITYRLWEGEHTHDRLVETALAYFPNSLSNDPRSIFGDVGFVEVQFKYSILVPGEKYTVQISVEENPAPGSASNIGVWTSLNDPYDGGRFFFPFGIDNSQFESQDMLFRIEPLILGPTDELASLWAAVSFAGLPNSLAKPIRIMLTLIGKSLVGGRQAATCGELAAFGTYLETVAATGRLPQPYASEWLFETDRIESMLSCN